MTTLQKDRDFLDVLFRSMKSGAFWIKFFTVFTGIIQWAIVSLSADGYSISNDIVWIHVASGIFGSAMAVVEGFAIAYVFSALSKKWDWALGILTILMSVSIVLVIAPSTYARTLGESIGNVLSSSMLWIWATSLIGSRMITVASVAWAKKIHDNDDVLPAIQARIQKMQADFDSQVQQATSPLKGTIDNLTSQLQSEIESKNSLQEWSNELQQQVSSLNEEIDSLTQQLKEAKTTLSIEYDDSNIAPTIERLLELYSSAPNLSQQVASVIIGCSRQNVGQLLKKLEDDGKVKRDNGTVIVLEKEKDS